MARVVSQVFPPFRRALAVVLCGVLLVAAAGCTDDEAGSESTEPPSASLGPGTTLKPEPVPLDVRVTRVAGKLNKQQRKALETRIGRAVSRYFNAAWLGDAYPRSNFRNAFPHFTRGATRLARADRRLTTNARLGKSTEAVHVKQKRAYLQVFAPRNHPVGVTARIGLVFVAERGDLQSLRVKVSGRLLLTPAKRGWQIFGYDIARSVRPVGKETQG